MMFALKKMQTIGSRAGSSAELFFKTSFFSFFPSSLRKKHGEKKTTSALQNVCFKQKTKQYKFPFFFFIPTFKMYGATGKASDW